MTVLITFNRVWNSHPGIRDLTIIQCGIRETLTGYGIWLLPRKRDSPKQRGWERERYWGEQWRNFGTRDSPGIRASLSKPYFKRSYSYNHAWRFLDTGLGNSVILGRARTEVRDAGFSTGSGPPFPDPISKNHARSQAWRSLERRKHSSRDLR